MNVEKLVKEFSNNIEKPSISKSEGRTILLSYKSIWFCSVFFKDLFIYDLINFNLILVQKSYFNQLLKRKKKEKLALYL